MHVLWIGAVGSESQVLLRPGSVGGLVQGSTDQISKKVHGQTERCNDICVPILSSQEPRCKNCTNARHCMLSQAAQVRPACERVAMLNALAQSRSAPVKGASEKGRGRGKDKGKGKGQGRGPAGMSTLNEVMSHVIPLIMSLDRRLGTLEDRSTFVAILYDEQWKKDLSERKRHEGGKRERCCWMRGRQRALKGKDQTFLRIHWRAPCVQSC